VTSLPPSLPFPATSPAHLLAPLVLSRSCEEPIDILRVVVLLRLASLVRRSSCFHQNVACTGLGRVFNGFASLGRGWSMLSLLSLLSFLLMIPLPPILRAVNFVDRRTGLSRTLKR
jgi:hypothetical protein